MDLRIALMITQPQVTFLNAAADDAADPPGVERGHLASVVGVA